MATAFRSIVQDVSVIRGEQDVSAGGGSFVKQRTQNCEILQVPIGRNLDRTAEAVIDGVDDNSNDEPSDIGDFTESR